MLFRSCLSQSISLIPKDIKAAARKGSLVESCPSLYWFVDIISSMVVRCSQSRSLIGLGMLKLKPGRLGLFRVIAAQAQKFAVAAAVLVGADCSTVAAREGLSHSGQTEGFNVRPMWLYGFSDGGLDW